MKVVKTLLAALALSLTLAAPGARASDYPPDYAFCNMTDSVTSGPFEIIRKTTRLPGRGSTLTVAYRGYLRGLYPDNEIRIYVSLNGQNPQPITGNATLQASAGSYNDAYILLNANVRSCQKCLAYMTTWQRCMDHLAAGNPEGQWVCEQPSALENHMFTWAFDANYGLNAWDVYVAAESHGQWDSNFGANYYGRLPARTSCTW
ncbi:hypothetical protein P2318_29090 [Myxococcaceae bacterium GXIMD 01537]